RVLVSRNGLLAAPETDRGLSDDLEAGALRIGEEHVVCRRLDLEPRLAILVGDEARHALVGGRAGKMRLARQLAQRGAALLGSRERDEATLVVALPSRARRGEAAERRRFGAEAGGDEAAGERERSNGSHRG